MNIFSFIGNVLDKSSVAIDETLNVVVVAARTTRKTVEMAEDAIDILREEQRLEAVALMESLTVKPQAKKS